MKINFDKPLHDQDFKPILEGQAPKDGHKDERPTATLRLAIRRALMSDAKDEKDKTLSEDERFKRFQPPSRWTAPRSAPISTWTRSARSATWRGSTTERFSTGRSAWHSKQQEMASQPSSNPTASTLSKRSFAPTEQRSFASTRHPRPDALRRHQSRDLFLEREEARPVGTRRAQGGGRQGRWARRTAARPLREAKSSFMLTYSTADFYESVVIGQLPQVHNVPKNPKRPAIKASDWRPASEAEKPRTKRRIDLSDREIETVLGVWKKRVSALTLPFVESVWRQDGKEYVM